MVNARTYIETYIGDDEIVSVSREPSGKYRFSHAPHHHGPEYDTLDDAIDAYQRWLDEYITSTRDSFDVGRASVDPAPMTTFAIIAAQEQTLVQVIWRTQIFYVVCSKMDLVAYNVFIDKQKLGDELIVSELPLSDFDEINHCTVVQAA